MTNFGFWVAGTFFERFQSFQWMSRVLQAVDSIHQVGLYCLALVPHNHLPKTPLGKIFFSSLHANFEMLPFIFRDLDATSVVCGQLYTCFMGQIGGKSRFPKLKNTPKCRLSK